MNEVVTALKLWLHEIANIYCELASVPKHRALKLYEGIDLELRVYWN